MDDKTIMTTTLGNVKGACDLLMHGAIESSTPNVRNTFSTALNETLTMQNDIYSKMSSLGWYLPDCAEQQKIDEAKQKFSC